MSTDTLRPVWHTAGNGHVSPALLIDDSSVGAAGQPAADVAVRWPDAREDALPARHLAKALDLGAWARRWRECGGPIVDVMPWEGEQPDLPFVGAPAEGAP